MIWTVLALILMVVLGGFIAYYGDLQGRRWGKKRVSLFGLRPKHTAILITSLTGAFIVLLSMGTLLVAVPTVRDIVLRGEQAIRENKRLNASILQERLRNDRVLTQIRSDLNTKTAQLTNVNTEYHRAESDLRERQAQLQRIEKQNLHLGDENMTLQRTKYSLQSSIDRLKQGIAQLRTQRERLLKERGALTAWNSSAASLNHDLSQQNFEITRQNTDLERQNENLKQVSDDLKREADNLAQANKKLLETNSELLANNTQQTQKARELQGQLTEIQEKLDTVYGQLAGTTQAFNQSYGALRQGRLILRSGAELGRRTLEAHLRPEAVKKQLVELLEDAGATALSRGAARGENGRGVAIIRKRFVTLAGTQVADEQASLTALTENLAGSDTPMVVLANVVQNSVAGEQVIVELTSLPVQTVFAKGALVASRSIQADQPVEKVVNAILSFLQGDVRDAAINAGMIPAVDPETGAKQVGILGPTELVQLTEKIRRMRGTIQLNAVAETTLTSADPLRLTFQPVRLPKR